MHRMTRSPRRLSPPYLISSRSRHVADLVLACVPERAGGYVEPYLNSGACALAVVQSHPELVATLAATNPDLVRAWEVARERPDELIEALVFHAERHRPAYFNAVRGEIAAADAGGDGVRGVGGVGASGDSGGSDDVARAARYIYLRGTAVPDARGEPPVEVHSARFGREVFAVDPAGVRALSRFLGDHDVRFAVRSPFELLADVREDDLVVVDPPFSGGEGEGEGGGGSANGAGSAGGGVVREVKSFVGAVTARGGLVLAPAPRGADAGLYSTWPGMTVVGGEGSAGGADAAGDDAVWGNGAVQRLLRVEQRERR